jgi:hypothetical protein
MNDQEIINFPSDSIQGKVLLYFPIDLEKEKIWK